MSEHNLISELLKTHINAYCPFCRASLNKTEKESEYLAFKAEFNSNEIELKLSPYINVYEIESEYMKGDKFDDLSCPHCGKSLVTEGVKCPLCDYGKTAMVLVSSSAKLVEFYICLRFGCEWHNLTKADEKKLKPVIRGRKCRSRTQR